MRSHRLSRSLLELLGDACEVVVMSLSVFINMFQKKHLMISSTAALKLAQPLLLLLENVRLCTSTGCCPETLCLLDFWAFAQVGWRSCF